MDCNDFKLVKRRLAGSMLIAAVSIVSACHDSGTEPPAATVVGGLPPSMIFDALGATQQLGPIVRDQHGQPMTGVTATFGTTNAAVATVSPTGLVTAVGNGTAQITVVADTAHGESSVTVEQLPYALTHVSGENQDGVAGEALAQPLVVRANDRLGHPVADVPVTFATTGGGMMTPATAATDMSGQAQTMWTLGGAPGIQLASATFNAMPGLGFVTQASVNPKAPAIVRVTLDTLVEGVSLTITGSRFDPEPAANLVRIDSIPATVSSASTTSLTVTVPTYGCAPARIVGITIQAGGLTGLPDSVPLYPAKGFLTLAVGEEAIVQDPADFCLQFRAGATGPESYILGLSAPAEAPESVLVFRTINRAGLGAPSAVAAPSALAPNRGPRFVPRARPRTAVKGRALDMQRRRVRLHAQRRVEARLRAWEAPRLRALAAGMRRRRGLVPPRGGLPQAFSPVLGDTLTVHVPYLLSSDPCSTYATIHAVVRAVGSAGIWVTDVQNPTTDSLTQADIQSASDVFDAKIYASDTTHFGHPTDLDNNGRIVAVLTRRVNQVPGLLGFVFAGDLFPGSSCPESNVAELYYGEVPDPANVTGSGAHERSDVVAQMPLLVAHEVTHVIQFSQRLVLNDGVPLASWEAEGQATFAEELAGHAVLGNTSYQNYGSSVAFGPTGVDWYPDEILRWAEYYGDLGPHSQALQAPDLCTVYGGGDLANVPCDPSAFYGASWILQRYIGDQFGPAYPGGLGPLTRDWIMKSPTLAGTANISALLGVNYDTLFVRFATALAIDDRNNGNGTAWVPGGLSITTWNSDSIGTFLTRQAGLGWFYFAYGLALADASWSRNVRGGSTAYWTLNSTGAHPAVAERVVDWYDRIIQSGIRPTLWVVRTQ